MWRKVSSACVQVIFIINMALAGLLTSPSLLARADASVSAYQKSVERKLALVQAIAAKVEQTVTQDKPKQFEKYAGVVELLKEVDRYIQQGEWASAEPLLDHALKVLAELRGEWIREQKLDHCDEKRARLKSSLKVVLDTIKGDKMASVNAATRQSIIRELAQVLDNEDNCRVIENAASRGMSFIQDHYSQKTAVVKLDLSTPQKRFDYDARRYVTYQLLYQQRASNLDAKSQRLKNAEKKLQEAEALNQKAKQQAKNGNYKIAEKSQAEANKEIIKALRLIGIYLAE